MRKGIPAVIGLAVTAIALGSTTLAGPFRSREWFNKKFDEDFHIRGRCFMSKGKGDELARALVEVARTSCSLISEEPDGDCIYTEAPRICERFGIPGAECEDLDKEALEALLGSKKKGDATCVAKKKRHGSRFRPRRASGTLSVFMKTYRLELDGTYTVVRQRNESSNGKKKVRLKIDAQGPGVTGLTACIEAQKKGSNKVGSTVVLLGSVPETAIHDGGYREGVRCSARRF